MLQDAGLTEKLFTTLAERYASRAGGYTRVLSAGFRYGDAAPMAMIELVDRDPDAKGQDLGPTQDGRRGDGGRRGLNAQARPDGKREGSRRGCPLRFSPLCGSIGGAIGLGLTMTDRLRKRLMHRRARFAVAGVLAFLLAPLVAATLAAGAGAGRGRAPGAGRQGADPAVLRAHRAQGGAGRGQHLHQARGRDAADLAAVQRSVLPAIFRRRFPGRAAEAGAGLARLGRHPALGRRHRHQPPRHRGRAADHRRAVRPARVRGDRDLERRAHRSRHPAHRSGQLKAADHRAARRIRTSRSATWCWPSAIPSASVRR